MIIQNGGCEHRDQILKQKINNTSQIACVFFQRKYQNYENGLLSTVPSIGLHRKNRYPMKFNLYKVDEGSVMKPNRYAPDFPK